MLYDNLSFTDFNLKIKINENLVNFKNRRICFMIILLGCLKNKYTTVGGKSVTNDAVRCLGIYIGHNNTQCYELNWLKTSDDMQK